MLFTESKGHFPQLRKRTKPAPVPPTVVKATVPTSKSPVASLTTPEPVPDHSAPPPLPADAPPVTTVPTPPKRPKAPLATVAGRTTDEASDPALKRLPIASDPATTPAPVQETPTPVAAAKQEPPSAPATTPDPAKRDAEPPATPRESKAAEPPAVQEIELLASAQRLLTINTGFNPETLASHLLNTADIEVSSADADGSTVKALYNLLESSERTFSATGRPQPGDFVFFSNTYDRDEDERPDDWFTMVGVVEQVGDDGTVQLIGFAHGRVQRLWMNLDRPAAAHDESLSKVLNSQLRAKSITDRPFTRYYAGELFAAFGRP